MQNVFIVGCGDIGRRVAKLASEKGSKVTGLVRSEESAARLKELGITPFIASLDDRHSLVDMPTKGAIVFYFAPPPGGGSLEPRVRNFCAAVKESEKPAKLIYISTSGVYGDTGGETVTEETPVNPQTSRAKRRRDAETVLTNWGKELGVPVIILRVTGIYGPGRLPINKLMEGQPVLRQEEASFTNRIHADDLAQVCIAAAEKGDAGDIFNVSDGHPTTMTEYFNAVADAAGLPRPRQVNWEEAKKEMAPLMLSYFQESRRMDNTKMLKKLGVTLRYPDLQAGLKVSMRETGKT